MTTPSETLKMHPLTKRPAWKALEEHYQKMRNVHLRSLFADDPQRGERLVAEGTDVVEEMEKLSVQVAKEFPRSIFFAGKLVFERERGYQRILHNETAYAIQRRLQFGAMNCMVLPVRVFAASKA